MSLKQVNKWINSQPFVKHYKVVVKVTEGSIHTMPIKLGDTMPLEICDAIHNLVDGARCYDRWLNEKKD